MKIAEKLVVVENQKLILTNQRALFWKENSALIFSDLHLGKSAHFRKNGIAVPNDVAKADLQRLSTLIQHFQSDKIIVVGDFLHAGNNSEIQYFKDWKIQHENVGIVLVKGNHDRLSESFIKNLGIQNIITSHLETPFLFSHDFLDNQFSFQINGHLHPGISLPTTTKSKMRFPCYIKTEKQLILPAFSTFTGLDTSGNFEKAQKFIFDKDSIFEV